MRVVAAVIANAHSWQHAVQAVHLIRWSAQGLLTLLRVCSLRCSGLLQIAVDAYTHPQYWIAM